LNIDFSQRGFESQKPFKGAFRAEADLREFFRELGFKEAKNFSCFRRPAFEFDTCVNVLGVLAEDHHIDLLRTAYWRGYAFEPLYGSQANVEVQELTKSHVQGRDPAAHGRG